MEKSFPIDAIKNFEVKVFLEGQCNAFLPMSFIVKENSIIVSYYSEGYVPIEDLGLNNPFEVLEIVENLLLCLKDAENYLIPLNRFYVSKEYIYFSKNQNKVRLMFNPLNDVTEKGYFICKIKEFLKELKILSSDMRSCEYVDMIINKISDSNIGREALINYIGELKREVHICGWIQSK